MDILNSPLWFLTALFLVYAWYGLISRSQKKYWLLGGGLAVSVIWHYATPLLLPWSLEAVPYFTVFFAAGDVPVSYIAPSSLLLITIPPVGKSGPGQGTAGRF